MSNAVAWIHKTTNLGWVNFRSYFPGHMSLCKYITESVMSGPHGRLIKSNAPNTTGVDLTVKCLQAVNQQCFKKLRRRNVVSKK
jgi:hypothetical protein